MKKVLIADDDPAMRDAFRLIFERAGYETTVLSSARPIMDGTAPLPGVYILDKQLSGIDGLDVCRFLKVQEASRGIPVIIVSATPHVARLAVAVCADAFVEKPFSRKELLAVVARCIAQASEAI